MDSGECIKGRSGDWPLNRNTKRMLHKRVCRIRPDVAAFQAFSERSKRPVETEKAVMATERPKAIAGIEKVERPAYKLARLRKR